MNYRWIIVSFALILAVMTPSVSFGAVSSDTCRVITPMVRPFLFSVTLGSRINTGGNENEYWFGRQASSYFDLTMRFTGFLCRHWGLYGDLSFGGSDDDWTPPVGERWEEIYMCGVAPMSMGVGLMYRYESNRWQFYGRTGVGYIDPGYKHLEIRSDEEYWEAKRFVSTCFVNGGVVVGYLIWPKTSLVLDVNYSYPIGRIPRVEISMESKRSGLNPGILSMRKMTTRRWGNDITVSVGIQFQWELSKAHKRKK